MRHVLLLCAIAAGARGMVQAPAVRCLITLAGHPLGLSSRFFCTGAGAINLAMVAASANKHLIPAARAQKEPC